MIDIGLVRVSVESLLSNANLGMNTYPILRRVPCLWRFSNSPWTGSAVEESPIHLGNPGLSIIFSLKFLRRSAGTLITNFLLLLEEIRLHGRGRRRPSPKISIKITEQYGVLHGGGNGSKVGVEPDVGLAYLLPE